MYGIENLMFAQSTVRLLALVTRLKILNLYGLGKCSVCAQSWWKGQRGLGCCKTRIALVHAPARAPRLHGHILRSHCNSDHSILCSPTRSLVGPHVVSMQEMLSCSCTCVNACHTASYTVT